jgi:aminopeptidase N
MKITPAPKQRSTATLRPFKPRLAWSSFASLYLLASVAPLWAQDPLLPNHGDRRIDVKNYTIDLETGTNLAQINGVAKLLLTTTEPMRDISLDLHALTVSKVLVNGLPALFRQANDKLHITPRFPLVAGTPASVTITYGGNASYLPYPWEPIDGNGWWVTSNGNVQAYSDLVGASTWYPCNDWFGDKATYNISVTVPNGLTAIASGLPVKESALGQRKRFSFIMSEQVSTTETGVSIGRFTTTKAWSSTGIPISLYMAPSESPEIVNFTRKHLVGSIDTFSRILGKFPHTNCSLAVSGDNTFPGDLNTSSESNGAHITVTRVVDRVYPEFGGLNMGINRIGFAVASIWFGDAVSTKDIKDLWLTVGISSYFNGLYQAQANPGFNRALFLADYYDDIKKLELEGQCLGPLTLTPSSYENLDYTIFYGRGQLTIYALEMKIGKAATLGILRSWVEKYRNRQVTTEDFINHVTSSTQDPGVRPLLMSWIYDTYMPPFPGAAAGN